MVREFATANRCPKSIPLFDNTIKSVDLQVFWNTSKTIVFAAVYTTVKQPERSSQELLDSNSHLPKKDLSVPKLDLAAADMTANILENKTAALHRHQIKSCYGWSESMTVL